MRPLIRYAVVVFSACACLQGCGSPASPTALPTTPAEAAETATATVAPTITDSPTRTRTPLLTSTRRPTPIRTFTPANACGGIVDGWWGSEEVVETYWTRTPFPMVQFSVGECHVWEFILVIYPSYGKLFEADLITNYGIIKDHSVYVSFDNPGGAGALTISGVFPTSYTFQGEIAFSRGFQIGDFSLPRSTAIPFHANLALRNT
jgi:hypothetical protein